MPQCRVMFSRSHRTGTHIPDGPRDVYLQLASVRADKEGVENFGGIHPFKREEDKPKQENE